MKKLRLMVIRSEKDRLLRDLERFGCVEFSEMEDEALRDEVEGVLREMFRDGTAQKVAEKYWIEPESLILE